MFEKFDRDARGTILRAREQAKRAGSPTLEAEHFLLALAEAPIGRAGAALTGLGVTEEAVRGAMDRELVGALASVGVREASSLSAATPRPRRGVPRWGQSAKLAIQRALEEAVSRGDRRIGNEHVLLALVGAEAGVVPRLLNELDLTPDQIRAALA
jgi:ATP-dependent Clp protease ATP-binding subunit ClpA